MSSPIPPVRHPLHVPILPQPTDTSCGPTCLQAIYAFYGDEVPLEQLIDEIPSVEGGGTLAVLLGVHALKRGYRVRLYTFNLKIFDPSWFYPVPQPLASRLREQLVHRSGKRRTAILANLDFVELGGEVLLEDLNAPLLERYLSEDTPILTGLSATFLYRSAREIPETGEDDDIRGDPLGHFVVVHGWHPADHTVCVADPYCANPIAADHCYVVPMDRLLNAILLGVLTYDGNLLVIRPPLSATMTGQD